MTRDPATLALVGPGVVAGDDWDAAIASPGPLAGTGADRVEADHLVLCPAGVTMLPGSAASLREMLLHDPEVDLAYFDGFDDLTGAHFRPGFSPDRLRAQMYLGPALLVRRRIVQEHLAEGGEVTLPATLSQANDLVARCRTVAHLPLLLYRVEQPQAPVSCDDGRVGRTAPLPDSAPHDARLAAEGFPARAVPRATDRSTIDLHPRLDERPLVSVVMPTRGGERDLDGRPVTLCLRAVDRLLARTTYRPYELIVVLTPGAPDDLANRVLNVVEAHDRERRPAVRFCRDERDFNFSNACNRGATFASGSVLVFLNDDTAVRSTDWLERLVMYATRPDVGAVGARLLYGDGTIQHTGIWTRGGHPAHRYEGFPADHRGHLDSLTVPQNCLAVTGACLAVESAKFREVGGFCPEFASSYNDVDLCLKLADLGHRTVVDPGVVLHHYEASSRDPAIEDWELALLHRRWRRVLIDDPYDNPNHLAPQSDEFPAPDPMVALLAQRAANGRRAGHLPRLWHRTEPGGPGTGGTAVDRQEPYRREVDRHVV